MQTLRFILTRDKTSPKSLWNRPLQSGVFHVVLSSCSYDLSWVEGQTNLDFQLNLEKSHHWYYWPAQWNWGILQCASHSARTLVGTWGGKMTGNGKSPLYSVMQNTPWGGKQRRISGLEIWDIWAQLHTKAQNSFIIIIITRFYKALFTPEGCLKALPTLLPLVTGPWIIP